MEKTKRLLWLIAKVDSMYFKRQKSVLRTRMEGKMVKARARGWKLRGRRWSY